MPDKINKFVILTAPRSGSNMLCSLLNSHTNVLCHHEIFNPENILYALEWRERAFSPINIGLNKRDQYPLHFLETVWLHNEDASHLGFKISHYQNKTAFDRVLADPQIKKVLLQRKSVIKAHVSRLLAEQSGVWEDYGNACQGLPGVGLYNKTANKVTVDLRSLQQDIQFNQNYFNYITNQLDDSKQTYFQLDYESLQNQTTQHDLLHYLNLPIQPLKTRSRKQNSDNLQHLVANLEELKQQLGNSEFSAELSIID